jgi:hypothetical protein
MKEITDKLILIKRKYPFVCEIHRNEISQTKNLVLSTTDLIFAQKIVDSYNEIEKYKKAYAELSCYFDSISDEEQPKVAKRLKKIFK